MSTKTSNDVVAALKRVRIPFWSKWLGAFRSWARRVKASREIHHIATVYRWTYWTDMKSFSRAWYICKEDGRGMRSFEYGAEHYLLLKDAKSTALYASTIAPWVLGKHSNETLVKVADLNFKQPDIPAS